MNILNLVEVMVKIIGYTMVLYGMWQLIGRYIILQAIDLVSRDIKRKSYAERLNRINSIDTETAQHTMGYFHQHIRTLVMSLNNNNKKSPHINFYAISLFLFFVTFVVIFLMLKDFIISLLLGLVFLILPYLFLRFRLITKRLKTSMTFMDNFHILIQAYNSSSRSAYHMVNSICNELDDKELKKAFMKLLASMQQEREEKSFRESIDIFIYSINSSFAIRFGNLLSKAYLDSSDISLPLDDLNKDITNRKNDLEQEKSLNVETKILGYLPLITLPLFFYAAYRLSTMYSFSALFNQSLNLIVFLVCLLFTIFSLFAIIIFSRPRSDI